MNRNQFSDRFRNNNLSQQEIDRQFRVAMEQQEQARLFEAAVNRNVNLFHHGHGAGAIIGGDPNPNPPSQGSIVFNGSTSYLSIAPSSISKWMPTTGDFTVEWFQNQGAAGTTPRIFSIGGGTGAALAVSIESGNVKLWSNGLVLSAAVSPLINVWNHIAVTRKNGVAQLFVAGSVGPTASMPTNLGGTGASQSLIIGWDGQTAGDYYNGYMTNFRWSNSAVYGGSGTYTVPTKALTVLPGATGTKLLLLGGSSKTVSVDSTGINSIVDHNVTWSASQFF